MRGRIFRRGICDVVLCGEALQAILFLKPNRGVAMVVMNEIRACLQAVLKVKLSASLVLGDINSRKTTTTHTAVRLF